MITSRHHLSIIASAIAIVAFGNVYECFAEDKLAKLERMVNSLANKSNSMPERVQDGGDFFPIFKEKYNAREQVRIRRILESLNGEMGDGLWPSIVKHLGDDRYALTFDADSRAESHTVGSLCGMMAVDLLLPLETRMPKVDLGNNYRLYPKSEWSPFDMTAGEDITKWVAKRPNKKLHELQIELCNQAIQEASNMKELSEKERQKLVSDLTEDVATIKKTGQPMVRKARFHGEYFATYSEANIASYQKRFGREVKEKAK